MADFDPKQLRNIRRFRGKTQWQLAKASGISQTKISLIERGYIEPSDSDLEKLKEGLHKLMK